MTMAWWTALAGGVLIGLSATLLLWLNGRVAGVSGIIGGVVFRVRGDVAWRAAFLVGLVLAAGLYMAPGTSAMYNPAPRNRVPASHRWRVWPQACWSASARAWATAVPVATACAASAGCPRAPSWRS